MDKLVQTQQAVEVHRSYGGMAREATYASLLLCNSVRCICRCSDTRYASFVVYIFWHNGPTELENEALLREIRAAQQRSPLSLRHTLTQYMSDWQAALTTLTPEQRVDSLYFHSLLFV